jgi:hypothetical protein
MDVCTAGQQGVASACTAIMAALPLAAIACLWPFLHTSSSPKVENEEVFTEVGCMRL